MKSDDEPNHRLTHTLLVGVDAEGRSDHALHAALWLAERLQAVPEFVHAAPASPALWSDVEVRPPGSVTEETPAAIHERLIERLRKQLAALGAGAPPMNFELHVAPGRPAHVILERAEWLNAEIIMLGSHKKRGVLDFGSTARAVLAKAPGGVWVQPGAFVPIARILVPIDLSEESLRALETARDLARAIGASITVLNCFPNAELGVGLRADEPMAGPYYDLDQLRAKSRAELEGALARFEWRGVAHAAVFEDGDPAQRILDRQGECDLVVMGSHGRTGLSAVVLGNVAYAVLRDARVPVLAIRHPERMYLV